MRSKKENYLLYIGAGILSCTSIIYLFLTSNYPHLIKSSSKIGNFENVFLILISTLIIAPIFEEIIFRGIFTKKKIYNFCFYLGSVLMILLTKNYYLIVLLILYYIQNCKLQNIKF